MLISVCCIVRCVFVALGLEWYSRCKCSVTHAMEKERFSMVSTLLSLPLNLHSPRNFVSLEKDRCKECGGRKVVRSRKVIEVCCSSVYYGVTQCMNTAGSHRQRNEGWSKDFI